MRYPVAINLADAVAMTARHRGTIDALLRDWLDTDTKLVETEHGNALRLRHADTPARQRVLSGLIDLLARQIGPSQIGRPIRTYSLRDGRWCLIAVPKPREHW